MKNKSWVLFASGFAACLRMPLNTIARSLLALALLLISFPAGAADKEPRDPRYPPARGFGYLGGFFVTSIDTTVSVFSNDLPLGARINLSRDLGFGDSETVPRAALGWRFGEKHLLTGGWYNIERDSGNVLEATIPLPPGEEFPIGANVDSAFGIDLYKLQYTWLFHTDKRVSLGIGGGLYIAGLDFRIEAQGTADSNRFDESLTAPLPVLGGRFSYRLTPRAKVTATADWFFIRYGDSSGVLGDFLVMFNHRTSKHVGFAGGLNLWTLNVDFVDDDILLEVDQGFVGYLAALTFHF